MIEGGKSASALIYNGHAIADRDEMLSLTDMWKASGSTENREPFNWARKEGEAFIEAVSIAQNLPVGQVLKARQGRNGGTFAHWQIALAYAKYLSPEFHMWCNTIVRSHMERDREQDVYVLPPPSSDGATREDFKQVIWDWTRKWLVPFIAERDRAMEARMAYEAQRAARLAANEVKGAAIGGLRNVIGKPENWEKAGVRVVPELSAETTFLTAWEVIVATVGPDDAHSKLTSKVTRQLLSHARQYRWPQGQTKQRTRSIDPSPTFPKARVDEWLDSGGRQFIERENENLLDAATRPRNLRLI